jgi:hypothetical protein
LLLGLAGMPLGSDIVRKGSFGFSGFERHGRSIPHLREIQAGRFNSHRANRCGSPIGFWTLATPAPIPPEPATMIDV